MECQGTPASWTAVGERGSLRFGAVVQCERGLQQQASVLGLPYLVTESLHVIEQHILEV
jgi:hypothetical protein